MATQQAANPGGNGGEGNGGKRPFFVSCWKCRDKHGRQNHHPDNCPHAPRAARYAPQQPPWDLQQQPLWNFQQQQLWHLQQQQQRQQQQQYQAYRANDGAAGIGEAPVQAGFPWRFDAITLDQQVEALIAIAGPTPAGVDPEEDRMALDIAARTFWTISGSFSAFNSVALRTGTSFLRAILAWQRDEVVLTAEERAIVEAAQPLA